MPITNVEELARLAGTSVASYATISSDPQLSSALANPLGGAKMAPSQAAAFAARYTFLSQQPNVPGNGFSATVFQDTTTGRKVLAIRGTEIPADIVNDFALADILGIGVAGFANNQGAELFRYWKQLTTASGQAVTYSDEELAKLYVMKNAVVSNLAKLFPTPVIAMVEYVRQQAGYAAFAAAVRADRGAESGTPGQPVIQPGEQVDVTGHSLGGHLAMLFARLFPSSTHEVVTLNAPTFFTWGDATLSRLGYLPPAGSHIARLEADGDGIHLLGNVDPGTAVRIAQENSPEMFAPFAANHSSATGTDAMNLLALFSQLDPARANDAAGLSALMRSASNEYARSFENMLDSLRRIVYGPDASATPVAIGGAHTNRAAFYDNMAALSARNAAGSYTNATFGALAGRTSVQATHDASAVRNDFAALLSLTAGATFSMRLTDPHPALPASLALYAQHRAVYEQWLLDRNLTPERRDAGQAHFTDAYLHDRADMLNWLAHGNTRDVVNLPNGGQITGVLVSWPVLYQDTSLNTTFTVSTNGISAQSPTVDRVVFGSAAGDTMAGMDGSDHLYGGGGADSLSGHAGADHLEGNADNDTLDGGDGNDTLLGGTGLDTYHFNTDFGRDLVIDQDGTGAIRWNGNPLPQGLKVFDGIWQSADRQVAYTLVADAAPGRQDLVISFTASKNRIIVRGWDQNTRNLGINFGADMARPTAGTNYIGDFKKKNDGTYYEISAGNYVFDGGDGNDTLFGGTDGEVYPCSGESPSANDASFAPREVA